jgi:hypothetical protein
MRKGIAKVGRMFTKIVKDNL